MGVENAIILAGGKGTRLRPLTFDLPKPLIKVRGKPLVEYAIEELERNNIKRIYLSIGYKANKIIEYINHRRKFGAQIDFIIESKSLGTGGAIKYALSQIEGYDDIVIVNANTIFKINLEDMYFYHKRSGALITIGSTVVDDVTGFGVIEEENGKIISFVEKPDPKRAKTNTINSGIYILNKKALEKMPKEKSFSLEKDFLEKICLKEPIYHYPISRFITVNDIEQYKKAEEAMKNLQGERFELSHPLRETGPEPAAFDQAPPPLH